MTALLPWRRHAALVSVVVLAIALVLVLAVLVDPALAQSRIGRNAQKEVESWTNWLIIAALAFAAIPLIVKRDLGAGVGVFLLACMIGLFVFAPDEMVSSIKGVARAISP